MRVALLVLLAVLLVAPYAAAAEPARPSDAAVLTLKKLRGVTVGALAPARREGAGFRLPARTVAVGGGVGRVELGGALRFRSGRRSATVSALRLTASRTSSTLSGKLGRSRVTLFSARGRPDLAGGVTVTKAHAALTRAAAARLKRALKLKRTPSTLGTLTLTASPATSPQPEPAPIVVTPAPTPTPTATPAPANPVPACADRVTTPAGSVDWIGCDLPGAGDLKSWTDYVQRPFPPACGAGLGTVVASGGAARIDPASAYDHRFGVADAQWHADGSATIRLQGTVSYTMPAHGIEETVSNLVIELAADGQTGRVFAAGSSNGGGGRACSTPATPYTGEHVLDLDLASTAGGWIRASATTVANPKWIGGSDTYAGRPWGSFRIAPPA
ncbi:MAG TPA: HtaA domain-containing protein [Solirubrobacter sp.]|nr:HtaA domain-containing protein [Solirubrobacter sp.]